jgi:rhamnogalacturonan endolyase
MQRTAMPEYLYILNGLTGGPVDSIRYQPAMTSIPFSYWGANERPFYQWMSIAYLDGMLPSIVTERGIGDGQPLKIFGWDFRNGHLTMRPDSLVTTDTYNSTTKYYDATPKIVFGGHSIRIKDTDNDGKDEVILTGAVVDHDMKLVYNQNDKGLGHGDMYEVLDIDPDRPGLEFFEVQQTNSLQIGAAIWDAATGEIIKENFTTSMTDPSRAGAACIVPTQKGAQFYGGTPGVMDYKGNYINNQNFTPCATAYWDSDLAKELVFNDYNRLTGNIQKYDAATGNVSNILDFKAEGCESRTMNGATMICDLLGDWREEILYETADTKELRIYTTTIPSENRIYTLMQNPGYRVQTTCLGRIGGFFVDYYLGPHMGLVPPSPFAGDDIRWSGTNSDWDVSTTLSWHSNFTPITFQQGKKVLFDHYGLNGTVLNTTIN